MREVFLKRRKSSVLVIILFLIFFLSVFSLSLSYSLRLKVNLFKRYLERLSYLYITRGILNFVIKELEKTTQERDYDFLGEEPFGRFEENRLLDFYDFKGTPIRDFKVYIFDEEARFNINTASSESLKKFLENFPKLNAQKLVDQILAYKDSQTAKLFYSIYELALLSGVDKNIFYGEDFNENGSLEAWEDKDGDGKLDLGIKDFLTIYGEGKVNINNASLEVLKSIEGVSSNLVEEIIKKRPFRSLEELRDKLNLSEEEFNKLSKKIKLRSNYFRVVVSFYEENFSQEVLAILKRDSSQIVYLRLF